MVLIMTKTSGLPLIILTELTPAWSGEAEDIAISRDCASNEAEAFLSAVRRYQCVDNGYGIVPREELLEREIKSRNFHFLIRVVCISSGQSPFKLDTQRALGNSEHEKFVKVEGRDPECEERTIPDLSTVQVF